ncbi:MAG: hypothetical protein GVY13_02520 [Alphaproteobacteria bacterium]|nr:hypothetical protein [Alphaproteobacteria bacterium]
MITIQDCIGLSSLSESEVDAIAEHEHVPEMIAVELGYWLGRTPDGQQRILWMIDDDIGLARVHGNMVHARELLDVRAHYLETHPTIH